MIGPSPCYINDGDYVGGFTREDIDVAARDAGEQLPRLVEHHGAGHHGRARTSRSSASSSPTASAAPTRRSPSSSRASRSCRTTAPTCRRLTTPDADPAVQRRPDRAADRRRVHAPRAAERAPCSIIDNVGHCPHLSAPERERPRHGGIPCIAGSEPCRRLIELTQQGRVFSTRRPLAVWC